MEKLSEAYARRNPNSQQKTRLDVLNRSTQFHLQNPCAVKHKGQLVPQRSENKNNNFLGRCAKHAFNDKVSGTEYNIRRAEHLTNWQMNLSIESRFRAKVIIIT